MTVDRIPECACSKTHLTRRVVSGGGVQYWMQCLRCGRATSQALATEKALQIAQRMGLSGLQDLSPWDQKLRDEYEKAQSAIWKALDAKRKEQWDANAWERSEAYRSYLLTPEWREKRELVMLRARCICEGCGTADAEEVHHLKYPREWGTEFLFDLVALCRPCHERIHGR